MATFGDFNEEFADIGKFAIGPYQGPAMRASLVSGPLTANLTN